MVSRSILCMAALLFALRSASAQETLGAGRVEIDSALLGGGVLVLPTNAPEPRGYVFDVGATGNISRRLGTEGDFSWAMSRNRTPPIAGVLATSPGTPNMLFYTGNLIYNPLGHDRRTIPYLEFGAGGTSVLDAPATFGLGSHTTHLTANVGGGLRWFLIPHWGVRADYRYVAIRGSDAGVAGGVTPISHAHRIYGALVLTF